MAQTPAAKNRTRAEINEAYPHMSPYYMPELGPPEKGKGGRDRRTVQRKEADMVRLAKMYLERWSLSDMALELQIHRDTVIHDLNLLRQSWQKYVHQAIDTHQAESLARIDRIEMMALIAWEESRLPQETTSTSRERVVAPAEEGSTNTTQQTVKETVGVRRSRTPGDPRYLDRLAWCVEQRCKILGLYAQPGGPDASADHLPRISPEQARGIAQRAKAVHEVLGPDARPLPIEGDWQKLPDAAR